MPIFQRLFFQTPKARFFPFLNLHLSTSTPTPNVPVAIFWDLTTSKPPTTITLYDAAIRLSLAARLFGRVKLSLAFSHPNILHLPSSAIKSTKSKTSPLHLCRVCGRRFIQRSCLINHFDTIHAREHAKRQCRLDSARGSRLVRLTASLSLKNSKYEKAARELINPTSLADELQRASFRVITDDNSSSKAGISDHVEMVIEEGKFRFLVVASGDVGLGGLINEARRRRMRTVVVGEEERLLRWADAGFTWVEVIRGKAKKAALSVTGKWRDRDVLKRLEWTFDGEDGGEEGDDLVFDGDSEEDEIEGLEFPRKKESKPWWKLKSDSADDLHAPDK